MALPMITIGCLARFDRRVGMATRSGSSAARGLFGVMRCGSRSGTLDPSSGRVLGEEESAPAVMPAAAAAAPPERADGAAGYANPDPSLRRAAFCGGTGALTARVGGF